VGTVLGGLAKASPDADRNTEDADRSANAVGVLVVGVELLRRTGAQLDLVA